MSAAAASAARAAPASRPVHPCVLSITKGGSQGGAAEFSTWAYITTTSTGTASCTTSTDDDDDSHKKSQQQQQQPIPNLVTASASTISIYSVVDDDDGSNDSSVSGKLRLEHRFSNLSGSVVFLERLAAPAGGGEQQQLTADALLVGFGGHNARLAVVKVDPRSSLLEACCLLDFTHVLAEYSHGAVAEEDAIFSATTATTSSSGGVTAATAATGCTTTLSCILGGGVAVVVTDIVFDRSVHGWMAREPYILPLFMLSMHLPHGSNRRSKGTAGQTGPGGGPGGHAPANNPNAAGLQQAGSMLCTGFGDIVASCFLMGYLEPVLVLLHSAAGGGGGSAPGGGRVVSGRLARENTAPDPMYVTALSICAPHNRTALLWTLAVTCDSYQLYPSNHGDGDNNLLLVVGANTLTLIEASGRLQTVMAVNGWAKSTCPASLLSQLRPNPALKLSIQLDGSHVTWLTTNNTTTSSSSTTRTTSTALIALRGGQVYMLQQIVAAAAAAASSSNTGSDSTSSSSPPVVWTLLPVGETLGAVGEVATLNSWSIGAPPRPWMQKLLKSSAHKHVKGEVFAGIVFAGSRLGDSMLLMHALETVQLPWSAIPTLQLQQQDDHLESLTTVKQEESTTTEHTTTRSRLEDDYERILAMEEEALYAPTAGEAVDSSADVVPPSDEDEVEGDVVESSGGIRRRRSSNIVVEGTSNKKRPRVAQCTVVRVLTPLDVLVNLGPLGPSCEGPIASVNKTLLASNRDDDDDDDNGSNAPKAAGASEGPVSGTVAHVFPAGFGSSGGIALVTVPGRDDRMILAEADCFNVECVYSIPSVNAVLLGMGGSSGGGADDKQQQGIRYLGVAKREKSGAMELSEIDTSEWTSDVQQVLASKMLNAGDFGDGCFAILVESPQAEYSYEIVVLQDDSRNLSILTRFRLEAPHKGDALVSSSPFTLLQHEDDVSTTASDKNQGLAIACSWSSGRGSMVRFTRSGSCSSFTVRERSPEEQVGQMEIEDDDDEERKIRDFYSGTNIVAVDLFKAPASLFPMATPTKEAGETNKKPDEPMADVGEEPADDEEEEEKDWSKLTVPLLKKELKKRNLSTKGRKADLVATLTESDRQRSKESRDARTDMDVDEVNNNDGGSQIKSQVIDLEFDDEDAELYGLSSQSATATRAPASAVLGEANPKVGTFLAVCRQSGELEVYAVHEQGSPVLCWTCSDCGKGLTSLESSPRDSSGARVPRSHMVHVREMRFFDCGLSTSKPSDATRGLRSFCLAMESSAGDFWVYTATSRPSSVKDGVSLTTFHKVPLGSVARPSDEQSRHRTKLMRKGIIGKNNSSTESDSFRFNRLFRFDGISGQEGLFAALARPLWVVADRGRPTTIFHRTRHSAPAGGKPRPVSGFCSGLQSGNFLVMHERVGRVGSQRLTLFQGLSNIFESQGIIPGGGLCIEKITMGVTVRRICFIDDADISSSDHPLYAMLVSRELEEDQSELNDDGMTVEERQRVAEEKEAAKIKRQVEADLGGFDLEHEWVEEIQRENAFTIDAELGGAPPVQKKLYSLWIVDAADNWLVVDSYDLDEWEHGMTMEVMYLSEFKEEPGSSRHRTPEETAVAEEDLTSSLFIAIGTGTVDHNGEDVCSKGRVLLFELNRQSQAARLSSQVGAGVNLRLVYTKDMHGPVATVGCLSTEGKNRLIIGAGSDINVEQWGANGKLTQVGFFRATMQVLHILLFKNFFLLSDAYDSLYFLVWREADKSLTLLAKDYDPIPVYGSGIMSRGANMIFLCHDDRQNLQFFAYAPGESAARGGNKLVCRADYHLGTQTIAFSQHACRSSLWIHSATPTSTLSALKQQDSYFGRTDDDRRLAVHFGTTDGGIGAVVPMSEPVYWRLAALQSVLANALPSDCGLSPRAWRLYRRTPRRGGCRSNDRKKGVVDGDLILQYADLPLMDQEDLASAIGSTVDLILDNLLELQCGSLML